MDSSNDKLYLQVFGIENEQVTVTIGYAQQALGKIDIIQINCSFNTTSIKTLTCQTADICRCA